VFWAARPVGTGEDVVMRIVMAVGLIVLLASCQVTPTLDQVRATSTADLQNAQAKAHAAGDIVGEACWSYLMAVPSPQGATTGVAAGIEDGRLVAMAAIGPCSGILGPIIMLLRP
jgi:hypothetical protein